MSIFLILSLFLESCTLNFSPWKRGPSSTPNFDELLGRMKNFKSKMLGSEEEATCSKEQIEEDYKRLMASVKSNSCSEDNFVVDKDEFKERACPKIKKEGYFSKIVKVTIAEEKNKKHLSYFQEKIDSEFLKLLREAQGFLKEASTHFNNESYTHSERAELLATYVENVLWPMRDIVVVMRSYLAKENDGTIYYSSLEPYLTENFVRGLSQEEKNLITEGPNLASNPFYMNLELVKDGIYHLVFSKTDAVRRDVVTLLKAPTAKNYVMALKWMTLHMMLSQVYLYETILGNKKDIDIPGACQTHFNGNMPDKFKFNYQDGVGEEFLENILASHGLTYKEGDSSYFDYYIENINKDPTKEGYSGLIPFENYKNALVSMEKNGVMALQSSFDDVTHFKTILQFKRSEVEGVFRGKVRGQNVIYAGHELFKKMLGEFASDEIAEIKLKNNEIKSIYPGKQNLSPYLLEVMQENGILDYSELITSKMKKKFVGRHVDINFPTMYSSPVWRDWSLKYLADVLNQNKDAPRGSGLSRVVQTACMNGSFKSKKIKSVCDKGNSLQNVADLLAEFRSGEKYIPTRRLEEGRFAEIYPFLNFLWINMRDHLNLLPEAKPFELNFLLDQMGAGNPWARLKFSYMVALDQLEYKEEGILPQYDSKNYFSKKNDQMFCKINNVSVQYNNLTRVGKILGLNKALSYNHGDAILNGEEKEKIWRIIGDEIGQRNAQLFSVKNGKKNYYQSMENISYKTILSERDALSIENALSEKTKNEIKKISKTTESEVANFFLQLYKMKDPQEQKKLFENFSKVNGIDNSFSLKVNFLALDDAYKKLIFKDLLRQAAQTRKLQILSQLESFCKMDINDEKEFKKIFYSTTKAQNDLNQMAGLPSVPEEVLSKINEMSSSEWRDMWWGLGSGGAAVAAIVIGGACTTLSGGICAPLGGAMAAFGLAALGIQVKITTNEFERKTEADSLEKQIKTMEDLGFSNSGSSEEVQRSYAWTAFEAMTIFPLIGVASRSLLLGPKLLYVSTRSLMKQAGKTSFKAAAKSVTEEEEVRMASYLLGLNSVRNNLGLDKKTIEIAKNKIFKIKKLYTSGEINLETMLERVAEALSPLKRARVAMAKTLKNEMGKVFIKQEKKQIDQKTAEMVSDYFADNPREMLRLVQGYSGERLNKSLRIMSEINAKDRIAKRIPIFGGIKDWALRMRNESLAKNATKILQLEKDLEAMGSRSGVLENYINKNIEELTDIFIEVPFRKREIPYFIFAQGMPEFNFVKGSKIPILSMVSEGQTLRRIFIARARLVHEAYKTEARRVLKLSRHVSSETTYRTFKAFQESVAEVANKKLGKELEKTMHEYRLFEESLSKKLFESYTANGKKIEYKKFKEMILNPVSLEEKAMAEAIWESIPPEQLLGMKSVEGFAHKIAGDLATYSDVDSFEKYLNALKILIINKNPAVLEIM